ncbi:MAG: hydrogenase formation protein HypD [Desulfobacterales bacterium]|nr:hydrogenase formation protein HypD [Desulfobacterales bacterium]
MKYMEEYRDPAISRKIIEQIKAVSRKNIRLMEVCGTHTTSIFRNGIRAILPDTISLLSGPGCPVCVTAQGEIDAFIMLSREKDVIVTTFGDLMRVPGSNSSLQKEHAKGGDIRVVYSTFDAIDIAKNNPGKKVVFLGVGFETTAPTIAAAIITARGMGLDNFFVFSAHKIVPPALIALLESKEVEIDGFILPGHVSVIIGSKAYLPVIDKYQVPGAIAGFEPADILQAIYVLVGLIESGDGGLANTYQRAVSFEGNEKAQGIMQDVFETVDVRWRGLGPIPKSGLRIRKKFSALDAQSVFKITVPEAEEPKGCSCGRILTGTKSPPECPLFRSSCTPVDPVGPCMVSTEGTCAAYYKYHDPTQ